MKENLGRALAWVAVFTTLCLAALFALVAVFGQLRFDPRSDFKARFANVSGLKEGDFVRIAGVEVGKVVSIHLRHDGTVDVGFNVDQNMALTQGTRAEVRYENLIGDRFLALENGPGPLARLQPGAEIPMQQTAPALNVDALIGGFRPLFRALDPNQINALSGQLLNVFQGEGGTVTSVLAQVSTLTSTLAGKDQLIGEVITNLDGVLDSFGANKSQLATGVDKLTQLVQGLATRKTDIANGLAYINTGVASVADLLAQVRGPLKDNVHQIDRTAAQIMSDHDYVDDLLKTLPQSYQILERQGIYGNFFAFYLCDAFLKVNGKDQNPIYIKIVGQSSGRCTPR